MDEEIQRFISIFDPNKRIDFTKVLTNDMTRSEYAVLWMCKNMAQNLDVVYLFGYLAANVAAKVSRDMRKDVYKKVELFSNAEFDKFSTASLITRTTNDITQIQNLLVMLIRMVFYAPILGVGGAIKALENSKELSWIIIVSLSAIVILIVFIFLVAMPKMTLMQKLVDKLNLVSRENIEGMLVTRAFNSQNFEFKRFDKANGDLKDTGT